MSHRPRSPGPAALLALVTACGGATEGVVVDVTGVPAGTASLDLALLHTDLQIRAQRVGASDDPSLPVTTAPVVYAAIRAQVDPVPYVDDGTGTFAIALDGAPDGGAFPLVVARGPDGGVLALGVFAPGEVFDDDESGPDVQRQRGKVVIAQVALEPASLVEAAGPGGALPPGAVLSRSCAGHLAGFAWAPRGARTQLRVLLPPPGETSAKDQLGAPDLDCDDSSAGILGNERATTDDKLDCDDLDPGVRPGVEETCGAGDADCDGVASGYGLAAPGSACQGCGTSPGLCGPAPAQCLEPGGLLTCPSCLLFWGPAGPCAERGTIDVGCGDPEGCTVTLLASPPGELAFELEDPAAPGTFVGPGVPLPIEAVTRFTFRFGPPALVAGPSPAEGTLTLLLRAGTSGTGSLIKAFSAAVRSEPVTGCDQYLGTIACGFGTP